jgi:putative pyoverdin transport system ATP-binding/permease protein
LGQRRPAVLLLGAAAVFGAGHACWKPLPRSGSTWVTHLQANWVGSWTAVAVISALGGISTAAILTAINSGAQAADSGKVSPWSAALFTIALFLFIKTQHYILITATAEIEAIIHKLRLRLMDHVRHSELLPLESIGRGEIVGAITKETATLTQMSNTLAFAAQGAVLISFVAMYVAYYRS